jgi:hypothetical protein
MADHEIPVYHIRSSLRFDSADVDDYLFFSKFYHSNLKLSAIDKEQLVNRFEDQRYHLRRYIQKFIGETKKPPKKEP